MKAYDTGDVICYQGDTDERPTACRAASRMDHCAKCVCDDDDAVRLGPARALARCQATDRRPRLLHILSGRARVTRQSAHGDVHAGIAPMNVRCAGTTPTCKCARAIERKSRALDVDDGDASDGARAGGVGGGAAQRVGGPQRKFVGSTPPACFEILRMRGVSHDAARPEFLEAAGLFNPVGWAVEACRPGSTKWVNARVLEVMAKQSALARIRARASWQLASDRTFELEFEPPVTTATVATHHQFVNASSLFGSDAVEYTVTAKEPTVVLTYHPSALDRMEATEPVVFAGLAKSVMANMAWQNSIINADHTHDYFFQVRCSLLLSAYLFSVLLISLLLLAQTRLLLLVLRARALLRGRVGGRGPGRQRIARRAREAQHVPRQQALRRPRRGLAGRHRLFALAQRDVAARRARAPRQRGVAAHAVR